MQSNKVSALVEKKYAPVLIAAGIFLVIGFIFFPSTGRDDVHITYWEAHSLAEYGELLNYNGERIEQSSSLFHVIILAALFKLLPLNNATVGSFACISFGLATLFVFHLILRRCFSGQESLVYILATTPYFLYWNFGGLETTLTSFVTLLLIYYSSLFIEGKKENKWLMLLIIIGFLLARPESFIIYFLFCFSLFFLFLFRQERQPAQKILLLLMAGIIIILLIFLFRLLYFNSFFPQPVYAKTGNFSLLKIISGIRYAEATFLTPFAFLTGLIILFLPFYIIILYLRKQTGIFPVMASVYIIIYLLFIFFSGGDWMEAGRFFIPLLPLALIVTASVFFPVSTPKIVLILFLILNFAGILFLVFAPDYRSTGIPSWSLKRDKEKYSFFEENNLVHLRDIPVAETLGQIIIKLNNNGYRPKINIMSGQMGFVAYHISREHFGRVRFLDLAGLATRDFYLCSETRKLRGGQGGINFTAIQFLKNKKNLIEKCGLNPPEIIFDLNSNLRDKPELLEREGYKIIFKQAGKIKAKYVSAEVEIDQFIAIRNDLLYYLDGPSN